MVNTSFTFHLGILEGGYSHNCLPLLTMYGGMAQVQFHLGNNQHGDIVIISFHLHQCMVEWHVTHSIEVIKNMALSYSLPL